MTFTLSTRPSIAVVLAGFLAVSASARPEQTQSSDSYSALERSLERSINAIDWGDAVFSGFALDVKHGVPVLNRDVDRTGPAGPALKVLTAMAALDRLGAAHRFTTELLLRGERDGRTWSGALVVRGDGDPTIELTPPDDPNRRDDLFDRWAKRLREEGLRKIDGPIVIDDAAFDDVRFPAGWPLDRLGAPELPEISAVNLNDNCLTVHWPAERKAGRAALSRLFPDLPGLVLFSHTVQVSGEGRDVRRYSRDPNSPVLRVAGLVPEGRGVADRAGAPAAGVFFGHALKARLAQRGVEVTGAVSLISRQAPPSVDLRLVDRHFSPPLREIARRMVTDERTLDAEVLLKALGAQRSGGEGSTTDGGMAVVDYLSGLGVHTHGMAVLDGSGLSSFNRVSARQIVEAMRAVLRGPDADLLRLIVPTYVPNLVGDAGLALLAASPAIRAVEGRIAGAHVLVGWTEGDARPPMAFALLVRGDKPAVEPVVSSHLAALARELASPPSAPAGARR